MNPGQSGTSGIDVEKALIPSARWMPETSTPRSIVRLSS